MPAQHPHTVSGSARHLARLYFEQNPLACWAAIVSVGAAVVTAVLLLSPGPTSSAPEPADLPPVVVVQETIGCGLVNEPVPHKIEKTRPVAVVGKVTGKGEVGKPLPVSFSLENTGGLPLSLLPALDGSGHGMRFPKFEVVITRDGKLVKIPKMARCGMTNPLKTSDFVTVKSGGVLAIGGAGWSGSYKLDWPVDAPGTYAVVFRYSLKFDNRSMGERNALSNSVPHEIPFGTYESAPVHIVVQ